MNDKLCEKLESIKDALRELRQEDDTSANQIKSDLFTVIKVSGEFQEYLPEINEIFFSDRELVFNSGHIEKVRIFNSAREHLISVIAQIQKEISTQAQLSTPNITSKPAANPNNDQWYQKPIGFIGLSALAAVLAVIIVYLIKKHLGVPL